MSVLEAIWNERRSAQEQVRPIVHVRVTTDALPGTVAALPITPERARTIRLQAFPGGTVGADVASTERLLEVVIHPQDWMELLKEKDAVGMYGVSTQGTIRAVMGIPVAERA